VSLSDVMTTLQVAVGSVYVNDFNTFGRTVQIRIPFADQRMTAADLGQLLVKNDKGQTVRLGTVMTVRYDMAPSAALRVDLHPAVRITAAVPPGKSVAEVAAACVKLAEAEVLGKGFRVIDLTAGKPR
jgi:multidrug efflux pump subunit AcrB